MLFNFAKNKKLIKVLILTFFQIVSLNINSLAETEKFRKIEKEENFRKTIEWEKLEIWRSNQKNNFEKIIWNKNSDDDLIYKKKSIIYSPTNDEFNQNFLNFTSFNRSIVINETIGPDISFLVPIGFKTTANKRFDFSVRGWNRRPNNSSFFAWNGGDAVANIYYQLFNTEKSSFDLNIGFRSLYKGDLIGGTTDIGEGVSSGFKWAYNLDRNIGIAIGAEQLIQFDSKTDTGRDIYFSTTKVWSDTNLINKFPLIVTTVGIGTGYLALWDETKFACTDLFDGAAVDINRYHSLCWGPFGTLSVVFNDRLSTFFEYNNYSFMLGTSLSFNQNYRLTAGLTVAESYDDYKLKNFDEIRIFGRFSIAF
mgnify:CR=1 FL=1